MSRCSVPKIWDFPILMNITRTGESEQNTQKLLGELLRVKVCKVSLNIDWEREGGGELDNLLV